MKRKTIIACLTYLWFFQTQAQSGAQDLTDIQQLNENLFLTPDEDLNRENQFEMLYQLMSNPINLNATSIHELSGINYLSLDQINHFLKYRDKNGPLLSIYELQVIEGFDLHTIEKIRPFVVVKSQGDRAMSGNLVKRIVSEENNYFVIRTERVLEEQKGYQSQDSSRYLGSPYKLFGRFRTSHSQDFSLGVTFEKDAGEAFDVNPESKQYGFDYYSCHLFLSEKGSFKRIALGDYQMQFGQGLVLGAGYNLGKSAETITSVKRSQTGLRPYNSVQESNFMRGAAFTYSLDQLEVTPFYSRLKQDGTVYTNTFQGRDEEYITGIKNIGLHRTYAEMASRKTVVEETFGLNFTYNDLKNRNLQFGATYLHNQYTLPIIKTPNQYNQFEFNGEINHLMSAYANLYWHNFLLFSEVARSRSGGYGAVLGLIGSLSTRLSISLLYRNYDKNFHSFYGDAFSESSRTINETGVYWGLRFTPFQKLSFSAYYDRFKFPWLRFGVNSPSQGYECLLRFAYRLSRKIEIYAQLREQTKSKSVTDINVNLPKLYSGIKRNVIVNLDMEANKNLSFRSRIQWSSFQLLSKYTQGLTFIQDVSLKFQQITISARYALFDTDDYENRQYSFEKNLPYVYSINTYADQGLRRLIMVAYKPNRRLTFWARYSRFDYEHKDQIGSGLGEISGNVKSEMSFQVRFKL